jgi:DNA-binding winged helix-turn-helix (wHTH) protein
VEPGPRRGFAHGGVVSFEKVERRRESSIRFDLFELDVRSGQLRRRGLPVDLPPQALRVLAMLAERHDEVVTRQEIKEALWPGQSYGDFDSRLNFAVKKLREALGDDADQPRYVQTVRNAGYRFIAPVREPQRLSSVLPNSVGQSVPDEGGAPLEPTRETLLAGGGFRLGRGGFLILAIAVLVAVAVAILALRQRQPVQVSANATAPAATAKEEYEPHIDSVTAILPQARQEIVITGHGFGLHVPYIHTDSPYLAIRDLSTHWAAGRIVPYNSDEVMVDVESWADTRIVISGFSGDYGRNGWTFTTGDEVEVAVWNPQSRAGPGIFRVTVGAANGHR